MKRGLLRKTALSVLAGVMVLSFASCALLQGTGSKDKEEIIGLAGDIAKTLVKMDGDKVVKFTDGFDADDNPAFAEALMPEEPRSAEQEDFIKAVAYTLKYEVDEDSAKVDKDKASVDVTFTMVDYESVLESGSFATVDDVVAAIDACDDTNDTKITFEFAKDGDEWFLSNLSDKSFGKLFEFCSYDMGLSPDLFSLVEATEILDGGYCVDAYVYFMESISDADALFTYDVYYDGTLIANDLEAINCGTYIWAEYCDPDYETLASGEYEFVIKCDGAEFTSMMITTDNGETQPTATTASGTVSADVLNSAYREIMTAYESEMRTVENVSFGSMDSCALGDITGDGFPELLIVYCADDEYGMSSGSSDYFTVADIRIYTVVPGETTATEMLHLSQAYVNVAGGFYTDVILLSNGNLLVEINGGDEDWSYSYTEYYLDGYTWQPLFTFEEYDSLNEDTWEYDCEYTINGTAATEEEFNAEINIYTGMFTSVLARNPYYGTEYSSSNTWNDAVMNTPDNILSYDEAWEVTA